MEINSQGFIAPADLQSLKNLSKLQKNEVVDIYPDGTCGLPYDAASWSLEGLKNAAWRTTRNVTHLSGNRDDLSKIKLLMGRSLNCYLNSGNDELLQEIKGAAHGLETLKEYYTEKNKTRGNCEQAVHDLEEVLTEVNSQINVTRENLNLRINPERALKLNELEASMVQQGGGVESLNEGIDYFTDKLQKFVLLNERNLSQDDKDFLNTLKERLDDARKEPLRATDHYTEAIHPLRNKISEEQNISFYDAYDLAYEAFYASESQTLIDRLDTAGPLGAVMNMHMNWVQEGLGYNPGHAFAISISKDPDDTYTVAQANAGAFALSDVTGYNFHMKFHAPYSISYPPIVEFKGVSQEELKAFLTKAHEMQYQKLFSSRYDINNRYRYENGDAAEKAYNNLFNVIADKRVIESRIPPRRAQVIGNCGLRSLKEEMIYAFQKSDKIELGNAFLNFGRSPQEFDLDPIKKLAS